MPIQLTLEMQSESLSLFITYSSCLKILSRVSFYLASISGLSNQLIWLWNFLIADWIKLVNFKNNHTYEYDSKLKQFSLRRCKILRELCASYFSFHSCYSFFVNEIMTFFYFIGFDQKFLIFEVKTSKRLIDWLAICRDFFLLNLSDTSRY